MAQESVNPNAREDGLTLADVATALSRRMRTLLGVPIGVGAASVAVLLLIPNTYTASIGVVPETGSRSRGGSLAGLAALAGVNLETLGSSQSPQFYAAVLQSRPMRYLVLRRKYSTEGIASESASADETTLLEILKPRGDTEALRIWRASEKLDRITDVRVDLRSGIIHLSVRHRSAGLAADIANVYMQELIRFNAETRQSQARARRQFLEERVAEAADRLASAEEDTRTFLEGNRQYENSPSLRFEFSRLQRTLSIQQELYLNLQGELDAARIAEVNDVPALTIVERAIPPERKSHPRRTLYLAVLLATTFFVVAPLVVLLEYRERLFPGLSDRIDETMPKLGRLLRRSSKA